MQKINKIVSVCASKDVDTWSVTSGALVHHFEAEQYVVVVPDADVNIFKSLSPSRFQVKPESSVLPGWPKQRISSFIPQNVQHRVGWYYQQLLKIAEASNGDSDRVVIWDADCVPLTTIEFFQDDYVNYLRGRHHPEIHNPYFKTIENLLGVKFKPSKSFISQCFPLRGFWLLELIQFIESRHGCDWTTAVLRSIDHTESGAAFSEYETLGNFFFQRHESQCKFIELPFLREGTNLVGKAANIFEPCWSNLLSGLVHISFEKYPNEPFSALSIGSGNATDERTDAGSLLLRTDLNRSSLTHFEFDIMKDWPFPDNSFKEIIAKNVIEHIDDVVSVFRRIDKCLMVGGLLHIEVPFIGSYNHGTDVTHVRGFTFEAFNFLFADGRNYLLREQEARVFNYECVRFYREEIDGDRLVMRNYQNIPITRSEQTWVNLVNLKIIPGSFGYVFRKLS